MARPRKFDETAVLTAARRQFWHKGYAATTMAELCAATGVGSQSLYGAFGDKHDLFVRTLDDYCATQVQGLAGSRRAAADPWAWLIAAVTFEDGGRLGLTEDGCYLSDSAAALARLDEEVQGASRRTYARILEILTDAVEDARAAGQMRPDADPDEAATALLVAMQGIEFLRKSGVEESVFDRAKAATVASLTRAFRVAPDAG